MISIAIPIFEEKGSIQELHDRVRSVMEASGHAWELLFINDGSHDGSAEILDALADRHHEVRVVHFRRNFGQTAAMMAGFDFAQGDIIIPMDGDLQNDPADIPKVLDKIQEGYDVVSGWRKDRKDNALQRNLPSIMANRLISWVSGVELHDFGCSLKAYRAEVIKGVRLYGEMHRFLPIYAKWHGARITEVAVNHHPRRSGSSKYGLERVLKVLADLITVKFLDKYALKPMYLFGACGLASLVLSSFFAAWALYRFFIIGEPFIKNPLLLLTVFPAMTGLLCMLMGLLAEMITRTFYESQGKTIYMVARTRNFQDAENLRTPPASSVLS